LSLPKKLLNSGDFDEIPDDYAKQLVLGVCGMDKSGKTHFSMTAPDPLVYFDIDIGTEGVVQKFKQQGKEIARCSLAIPQMIHKKSSERIMAEAKVQVEKFTRAYMAALATPEVRSIVIDNSTSLFELVLLSHFGKTLQIPKHLRTLPNLEMAQLVRAPLDDPKCNVNVIHILQMRKLYRNDSWDGKTFEWAGYNKMAYLVQAMLEVRKNSKARTFELEVLSSRHSAALDGEVWTLAGLDGDLEDSDCMDYPPFAYVAAEMVDGTVPEDWV
jgi:hypothetical protein